MSSQKKFKIQKGDSVVVLAGKHKKETGKVNRIDTKKSRVFVEGINIAKKHQKPTGQGASGIIDKVMSIHISNVALLDPDKKVATRVGWKIDGDSKNRVAKKSQTVIR